MSISKDDAKRLLRRQMYESVGLRMRTRYPPEFEPWRQQTLRIIKRIFGEESDHLKQFESISYGLSISTSKTPDWEWDDAYRKGLTVAELTLSSFIDEIDLFPEAPIERCPKCGSTNVRFLEIEEVGSTKYKLAIPQIAGVEWRTGKKVAYYNCHVCQTVFYTAPFKSA